MKYIKLIIAITAFTLLACNSGIPSAQVNYSTDTAMIAAGKNNFNQYCTGCHNLRREGIGPKLGGITKNVSADWLYRFIKDPQKLITSGDKRATELFDKYKIAMPSFSSLKEEDINSIISFLHTHNETKWKIIVDSGKGITNPVPEKIKTSHLVVNIKEIVQFPPTSDTNNMPLTRITKLDYVQGSGQLFVNDLRGKLYKLQNGVHSLYLDIAHLRPRFVHQPGLATGFGSFAFHPNFVNNGLLYTTHTESPGFVKADYGYGDSIEVTLQWVLTEWKAANPAAENFTGSSRELLRVDMVIGIHGIQEISFNPTSKPGHKDYGLLYIGVGDGGCVENGYPFLVHSKEKIWGTILRIDPLGRNSINGKYGIPSTNPFIGDKNPKTLGEIYALGFRNPHRITWSKSGNLIATNIGQHYIESLNLIEAGHDYGWPVREGNFVLHPNGDLEKIYPLAADDSINKITYPVAQFDHDEGVAISGGYEYSGNSIPLLKGKFFFGDIPSGRLFYIEMKDFKQGKQAMIREWNISINGIPTSLKKICGDFKRVDLHFGKDAKGELYILTKADGKLYRLENATN